MTRHQSTKLRPMPSFGQEAGRLVMPHLLSDSLQTRMRALLPRSVSQAMANEFLRGCGACAQIVNEDLGRQSEGLAEVRAFLDGLSAAAHRMQNAMHPLAGDDQASFYVLEASFDVLRHDLVAGVELPEETPELGELLSRLWRDLEAVRIGAEHAALKKRVDKQRTAETDRARVLVRLIAECFERVAGKLPPGHKEAWFAHFMKVIGDELQIECGHVVVAAVIRELKTPP